MYNYSLIGLLVGDEGKGKVETWLLEKIISCIPQNTLDQIADGEIDTKPILTRKPQGGANTGRTNQVGGVVYKTHQVPSGILYDHTFNVLSFGMYLNPKKLFVELGNLRDQDVSITPDKFGIDSKAHVTLDYHTMEDQANFDLEDWSSTGSGIKQTARDKQDRTGMRFVEFLDRDLMLEILKEKQVVNGMVPLAIGTVGFENFVDSYAKEREELAQYLVMDHEVSKKHGWHGVINAGSQGFRLDVDLGQYPGITSSNPAILSHKSEKTIGVVKMYESSVGTRDRAFVGRMDKELEDEVREAWNEKGTTTGRNREVGWFDAVAARYAVEAGNVDYLAGTCGDRMEFLHELGHKAKIVVGYWIDGKLYDEWHPIMDRRDTLDRATPEYIGFEPWEKFEIDGELSPNAKAYTDKIEELVGAKFVFHGTGPGSKDYIGAEDLFS